MTEITSEETPTREGHQGADPDMTIRICGQVRDHAVTDGPDGGGTFRLA